MEEKFKTIFVEYPLNQPEKTINLNQELAGYLVNQVVIQSVGLKINGDLEKSRLPLWLCSNLPLENTHLDISGKRNSDRLCMIYPNRMKNPKIISSPREDNFRDKNFSFYLLDDLGDKVTLDNGKIYVVLGFNLRPNQETEEIFEVNSSETSE